MRMFKNWLTKGFSQRNTIRLNIGKLTFKTQISYNMYFDYQIYQMSTFVFFIKVLLLRNISFKNCYTDKLLLTSEITLTRKSCTYFSIYLLNFFLYNTIEILNEENLLIDTTWHFLIFC